MEGDGSSSRDRVDLLEAEISRLHTLVVTTQHENLQRLNLWRETEIAEKAGLAGAVPRAFNGQLSKHEMFSEVFSSRPMRTALETGTFEGVTTQFMADRFLAVVTIEIDANALAVARNRCADARNIAFLRGDSGGVNEIWPESLALDSLDFAYLDAHWGEQCPLVEELDFVLGRAPAACIFIDDFEVDDDDGYGYDSYESMTLNWAAVQAVVGKHEAEAFYPMRRGVDDTSVHFHLQKPRGTLVVAGPEAAQALRNVRTLRPRTQN